jgi:hypothetical protein
MARTMLDEHRTPRRFWAEAINTTCHVSNHIFPGVAPQGVFRSRMVSPTVAKWFVLDARGTIDNVYRFGSLRDA